MSPFIINRSEALAAARDAFRNHRLGADATLEGALLALDDLHVSGRMSDHIEKLLAHGQIDRALKLLGVLPEVEPRRWLIVAVKLGVAGGLFALVSWIVG